MSQTLGELQSVRKWEHRKSVVRCRQPANTWPLCIIFVPRVGRRDLPAAKIDGALLWIPRGRAMDEVCRTLRPRWGVAWRGWVNLHPPGSGPSTRGRSPIVMRPATSNTSSPPQQLASHEATQILTFTPNSTSELKLHRNQLKLLFNIHHHQWQSHTVNIYIWTSILPLSWILSQNVILPICSNLLLIQQSQHWGTWCIFPSSLNTTSSLRIFFPLWQLKILFQSADSCGKAVLSQAKIFHLLFQLLCIVTLGAFLKAVSLLFSKMLNKHLTFNVKITSL